MSYTSRRKMLPTRTLSIVIPAFNEAERLPRTIDELAGYAKSHPELLEVIVVDDGSSDQTAAIAASQKGRFPALKVISYRPNAGKGYAIRRGVMNAEAETILLTDSDLSTPIGEVAKLQAALEHNAIAIGSRALDESTVRVHQAWYRQRMGKLFNRLMTAVTGLAFRDTQCGFKLLRRDAALAIFQEAVVDRFAWDVEMLMLAHRKGLDVAEVPVLWFNSPDSRVSIVRDSTRMFVDILKIRLRLGPASRRGHLQGDSTRDDGR